MGEGVLGSEASHCMHLSTSYEGLNSAKYHLAQQEAGG